MLNASSIIRFVAITAHSPPFYYKCSVDYFKTNGKACPRPGFMSEAQYIIMQASGLQFQLYDFPMSFVFEDHFRIAQNANISPILSNVPFVVTLSRFGMVDFTFPPLWFQGYCVLVNMPSTTHISGILMPFKYPVWLSFAACLFSVICVAALRSEVQRPGNLLRCSSYSAFWLLVNGWYDLQFAARLLAHKTSSAIRYLVILWSICGFISLKMYKTILVHNLTPLQVLDLSVFRTRLSIASQIMRRGIQPMARSKKFREYQFALQEPTLAAVLALRPPWEFSNILHLLKAGENQPRSIIISGVELTERNAARYTHLHPVCLTDCGIHFNSMMLYPKDHPFIAYLNRGSAIFHEGGFFNKLRQKYDMVRAQQTRMSNHPKPQSLLGMKSTGLFYGWCVIIALTCFGLESVRRNG